MAEKVGRAAAGGRPASRDTDRIGQVLSYLLDSDRRGRHPGRPGRVDLRPSSLGLASLGRWKIVEGTQWLMDFGPGQGNAVAALHFIRKHRFDCLCFIGRPGPSVTSFKTNGRSRLQIVIQIDPRRLDITLDEPRWRRDLAEAADELTPTVDLTDHCPGDGPRTRSFGRIEIEVDEDSSSIAEVHGVTGLSTTGRMEIRLRAKASVVDLGLAHFGGQVSITAHAGTKKTGEATVDAITPQFQNIRLTAPSIDRIIVTADETEDLPILGCVRFQPKRRNSNQAL